MLKVITIALLVTVAGIGGACLGQIADMGFADWKAQIQAELKGN